MGTLLIHIVKGAISNVSFNKYCIPAGRPNFEGATIFTGTDTNQIPPYDFVSYYPNAYNESAQLLINMPSPGL